MSDPIDLDALDALAAVEAYLAEVERVNATNAIKYADEVHGINDVTLRRSHIAAMSAELRQAQAALAAVGDEHHTMDELYEYRMLYNAHAARGWLAAGIPVVKSHRHSDGEPCFGGGWFIVVATLPTGQVSNHYRDEFWDLFDVPEVDLPPEYDGHTPQVAAERLRAAIAGATGGNG